MSKQSVWKLYGYIYQSKELAHKRVVKAWAYVIKEPVAYHSQFNYTRRSNKQALNFQRVTTYRDAVGLSSKRKAWILIRKNSHKNPHSIWRWGFKKKKTCYL
ncbi:MAG: hypothetical protein ACFFDI_21625 [Promethearchaeota archaeon]